MVGVRYILMSISRNPYRIGVPGKAVLLKNLRAPSCWKRKNYCQLLRTKSFFVFCFLFFLICNRKDSF